MDKRDIFTFDEVEKLSEEIKILRMDNERQRTLVDSFGAEVQRLRAENAELRGLYENEKEFRPLTWEQRGVPVL